MGTIRAKSGRTALAAALAAALTCAGCGGKANAWGRAAEPIAVAPPPATQPDAIDWRPAADLLAARVNVAGRVDYFHLAQPADYGRLMGVYGQLARVGPRSRPADFPGRAEKLCYYLNAHNLLALAAVAPFFGPGRRDPRRVSDLPAAPETGFAFTLDGERVTLADIRTRYVEPLGAGDPRPLLALCAGRRNDPPLRAELYEPARLDVQLEDQLKRVLGGSRWCEMDYRAMKVRLPAGVADRRDYYWQRYLAGEGVAREGIEFVTALMASADAHGRAWLDRGLGFEVVTATPADWFNNQPLFAATQD